MLCEMHLALISCMVANSSTYYTKPYRSQSKQDCETENRPAFTYIWKHSYDDWKYNCTTGFGHSHTRMFTLPNNTLQNKTINV